MKRGAAALLVGLALLGCNKSVEVLGAVKPAVVELPDGGLTDAPDLPDRPASADAGPRCDCGGLPLCTPDGCIDARGPTTIRSDRHHTCLVRDGRLTCWGVGAAGQLGLGDRTTRDVPSRVGSETDWRIASGGERHTCGVRAGGTLWCWGDNTAGQLGLDDTEPRLTPTQVELHDDWVDVDCGGDNCCALRDGGRLYCWGDNLEGKPGQDDPYTAPDVLVPSEVAGGRRYQSVSVGQGHVCAIDGDGGLWCWGRSTSGETGTNPEAPHTRAPRPVDEGTHWTSVSASQHHTCGTQQDGSLWCWGLTPCGELGTGVIDDQHFEVTPVRVGDAVDWAHVEVGWFHSCGLRDDGQLWCWGRTIEGQLGYDHDGSELLDSCPDGEGNTDPVAVAAEADTTARFDQVTLGAFHTCGIGTDDVIYCTGKNEDGELGLGDRERRYAPTPLP